MANKKRKFKKYRINWDAVKEALPKGSTKKKRRGRRLKKGVIVVLVTTIVLVLGILFVPKTIQNNNLKSLGYTSEQIKHIRSLKLVNKILDGNYYSDYLAEQLEKDDVHEKYLNLYASVDSDRGLEDEDFLLYNRLLDVGYEQDQLEKLFKELTFEELTPLLVVDYQWDESTYIEDVIANRGGDVFVSGSYYSTYKLSYDADTSDLITMLINPSYRVSESWAPNDIVDVDTNYALEGVQMVSEAANAFAKFSKASEDAGAKFYALEAYRSYETQNNAYQNAINTYGADSANYYAAPAGYSEHETGLAVNIASTYEPDISFNESTAYKWAIENCYDYGFIPRYQDGKTFVTGMQAEYSHFRYVGVDVAKAVKVSGLTYDEFYCLYLKSWENEENKPSETILNAANWNDLLAD